MEDSNIIRLIDKLKINSSPTEKIILFCGAGISIDSGLPGVKEIKQLESEGVFSPEKFKKDQNKKMIFWRTLMAQYSYNFNHFCALSMSDHGYIDTIITSNYDCLFEECIEKKFPDWILRESIESNSILKEYPNGKKLVKIHGDITTNNIKNLQILELTEGVSGNKEQWDLIFKRSDCSQKKILWVIGYAGKSKDDSYKYIKDSIDNGFIDEIYWMHLKNVPVKEHILEDIQSKTTFIPIKDARYFFALIAQKLSIQLPEPVEDSTVDDIEKLEKVREALSIANKTIELLKKLDSNIIKTIEEAEEDFDCLLEPGSELIGRNELFVLRRYNSYTPILPSNTRKRHETSKGGGYFLNCNGVGIVIDPGYDFVDNFINCEYDSDKTLKFNNIHAIFVTHAHNDHFGELDSLQNLLFQYNNRIKLNLELFELLNRALQLILSSTEEKTFSEEKKAIISQIQTKIIDRPHFRSAKIAIELLQQKIPSTDMLNELKEIISKVQNSSYKIKKLELFVSRSALKAVDGLIPLEKNCFDKIHILNPGDEKIFKGITIKATRAKHMDLYSKTHSVGLVFSLNISGKAFRIGFTGDTGYFAGLESQFRKCQVLIPHLGSIKPKELDIYKHSTVDQKQENGVIILDPNLHQNFFLPLYNEDKETAFYRNHLGILGLCTLISSLKARSNNNLKVVVISEYGEEMNSLRRVITDSLNTLFENKSSPVKIVTGDIGLQIDLTKIMEDQWVIEEEGPDENGAMLYKYDNIAP